MSSVSNVGVQTTYPVPQGSPTTTTTTTTATASVGVAVTVNTVPPETTSSTPAPKHFDLTTFVLDVEAFVHEMTGLLSSKSDPKEFLQKLFSMPMSQVNELAKTIIEQSAAASAATLDQSRNQANSAVAELMSQANSLRKQASDIMNGAIASLVMTVVASAISIGGAVAQFKALGGSGETSVKTAEAGAINQLSQGISGIASSIGNFINSYYQGMAKLDEAEGAMASARSQQLNSQSQVSQKVADDLGKLADQLISLLKEIGDAKAQMMQAMTRV